MMKVITLVLTFTFLIFIHSNPPHPVPLLPSQLLTKITICPWRRADSSSLERMYPLSVACSLICLTLQSFSQFRKDDEFTLQLLRLENVTGLCRIHTFCKFELRLSHHAVLLFTFTLLPPHNFIPLSSVLCPVEMSLTLPADQRALPSQP